MQLLIIPVVLAIASYMFSLTINKNERKAADQRNQTEREIAQDNQRETALQEYIDKISELLLRENLRKSQVKDEVQIIARVRTLTTLSRLDNVRKGILLKFLYESNLINGDEDSAFINLRDADFCEVVLSGQHLVGINLAGAKLTKAVLRGTNLIGANLRGADLQGADLKHSYLSNANFGPLAITTTKVNGIPLVHMQCANLAEANLEGADLEKAYMQSTSLVKSNIFRANIKDVVFEGAYIDDMTCSSDQLSEILSKIEEKYA